MAHFNPFYPFNQPPLFFFHPDGDEEEYSLKLQQVQVIHGMSDDQIHDLFIALRDHFWFLHYILNHLSLHHDAWINSRDPSLHQLQRDTLCQLLHAARHILMWSRLNILQQIVPDMW